MNIDAVIRQYLKGKGIEDWQIDCLFNSDNCYVDRADYRIVLLKDRIVLINFINQTVERDIDLGGQGDLFEIYLHGKELIIYGEQEISCIDESFNIMWSFSARDIFVRQDNKHAIELHEDEIVVCDWMGWQYRLDYQGNLLEEQHLYSEWT